MTLKIANPESYHNKVKIRIIMRGRRVARRTARRVSRRRGLMDSGSSEYDSQSETEQLSDLARLRDDGVITEDEFEAKKRQILDL